MPSTNYNSAHTRAQTAGRASCTAQKRERRVDKCQEKEDARIEHATLASPKLNVVQKLQLRRRLISAGERLRDNDSPDAGGYVIAAPSIRGPDVVSSTSPCIVRRLSGNKRSRWPKVPPGGKQSCIASGAKAAIAAPTVTAAASAHVAFATSRCAEVALTNSHADACGTNVSGGAAGIGKGVATHCAKGRCSAPTKGDCRRSREGRAVREWDAEETGQPELAFVEADITAEGG